MPEQDNLADPETVMMPFADFNARSLIHAGCLGR